jgi:acyl-CoA synthetase (AMP-forming)/AMP-acid ligase II
VVLPLSIGGPVDVCSSMQRRASRQRRAVARYICAAARSRLYAGRGGVYKSVVAGFGLILETQSDRNPSATAYIFLDERGEAFHALTYQELARRAHGIALDLAGRASRGSRVLILLPTGPALIEVLWGCLASGLIAVPLPVPVSRRSRSRVASAAADAQPALVIGHDAQRAQAPDGVAWCAYEDLDSTATGPVPDCLASDVALLQYTSGSTAEPRGVVLTHANIAHNQTVIARAFGHDRAPTVVSWLPPHHDMGLIGGILHPIYAGGTCVLMSPETFLRRPMVWLRAIDRYRAVTSGGPNFAYDLCVERTTPEDRKTLDLSCWRVAFNGAEPVRAATLRAFADAFAVAGFSPRALHPCYGLAEATLMASGGPPWCGLIVDRVDRASLQSGRVAPAGDDDGVDLVSCGSSAGVVIAGARGERLGERALGEIWVSGESIAAGYFGRPDESLKFASSLSDEPQAGVFLRTGDVGYISDGRLVVTGRTDELIIVRGRNLYPHDIEATLLAADPALRGGAAAAFAVEIDGRRELAAVAEFRPRAGATALDRARLLTRARAAIVAEHGVAPHLLALVRAGAVPKTTSGKIQRRLAQSQFLGGTLDVLARCEAPNRARARQLLLDETTLVDGLAAFAGAAAEAVREASDWTDLSLDSLAVVDFAHLLAETIAPGLDTSGLFSPNAADNLVDRITSAVRNRSALVLAAAGHAGPADQSRRSSYGQRALALMYTLSNASPAYHLSRAFVLNATIDEARFADALRQTAMRHQALRCRFDDSRGELLDGPGPELTVESRPELDQDACSDLLSIEAERPFDCLRGPLLRLRLITRGARPPVLLISAHHAIADLWSFTLFIGELEARYRGGPGLLLAPVASMSAYADWQASIAEGDAGRESDAHFADTLEGADLLGLAPAHAARSPGGIADSGDIMPFEIDRRLYADLRHLASRLGSTPFGVLLSAYAVLLFRHTGYDDLVIGTIASTRTDPRFRETIGYLANPLALRVTLEAQEPFPALLQRVTATVRGALARQEHPYPLAARAVRARRGAANVPLFNVFLSFQETPHHRDSSAFAIETSRVAASIGEWRLTPLPLRITRSQFDLDLAIAETASHAVGRALFRTRSFDRPAVSLLLARFLGLLREVVGAPDNPINQLGAADGDEYRELCGTWNESDAALGASWSLLERFEQQAARTPEASAVDSAHVHLTYRELDRRAAVVADLLRHHRSR